MEALKNLLSGFVNLWSALWPKYSVNTQCTHKLRPVLGQQSLRKQPWWRMHWALSGLGIGMLLAGCIGGNPGSAYSYHGDATCDDSSTFTANSAPQAKPGQPTERSSVIVHGPALQPNPVLIHYHRKYGFYSPWQIVVNSVPLSQTGTSPQVDVKPEAVDTHFGGSYWEDYLVQPSALAGSANGTITIAFQDASKQYDLGTNYNRTGTIPAVNPVTGQSEIWVWDNDNSFMTSYPFGLTTLTIHFQAYNADYNNWGIYLANDPANDSAVDSSKLPSGIPALTTTQVLVQISKMGSYSTKNGAFGADFSIPISTSPSSNGFVLSLSEMAGGVAIGKLNTVFLDYAQITQNNGNAEVWVRQLGPSLPVQLSYTSVTPTYSISSSDAQAYWLDKSDFIWPKVNKLTGYNYKLYYSATGAIKLTTLNSQTTVSGADGALTLVASSFPTSSTAQRIGAFTGTDSGIGALFSLGSNLTIASIPPKSTLPLGQQQLILVQESDPTVSSAGGVVQTATTAQPAGALDDQYASAAQNASLGVTFSSGNPNFSVWAPTAQKVQLCVYNNGESGATGKAYPMTMATDSGVWSYTGAATMAHQYYKYAVDVFVRATGKVEHNLVSDPYSISTSANGFRSYIADLANDATLQPTGWTTDSSPNSSILQSDMSIYHLHVRDFSVNDATVPAGHQGKYLAFTDTQSNGMKHLAELAQKGLTDVQLMPVNDFASVPEIGCANPSIPNSSSDSSDQQSAVENYETVDCYSAGYDSQHFASPEGSYSTDTTQGDKRILEFRQMVQALHSVGLRVGMDLNLSSTATAGQTPKDALDQIVPDYYHRLDGAGNYQAYTGDYDLASENIMADQLLKDTVKRWRDQYHIDSYRLANMSELTKTTANDLLTAANTNATHPIYFIGEDQQIFGDIQIAHGALPAAVSGSGLPIGTFTTNGYNGMRGGSDTLSGDSLEQYQGFINGQDYDQNDVCNNSKSPCPNAGGLTTTNLAQLVPSDTLVQASLSGSTAEPNTVVNYVEDHNTITLFDINTLRVPLTTSTDDRARVQAEAIAINGLSQGIAYFNEGVETMRSKSFDHDSDDAGDWFNKLDWTYTSNNYGVGLPLQNVNEPNWSTITPFLSTNLNKVKTDATHIQFVRTYFDDILAIRNSSKLFHMDSKSTISSREKWIAGTFSGGTSGAAMAEFLDGSAKGGGGVYDPKAKFTSAIVIVNADKVQKTLIDSAAIGQIWSLHPVLAAQTGAYQTWTQTGAASFDSSTGTFVVPPRSVIVWVQ